MNLYESNLSNHGRVFVVADDMLQAIGKLQAKFKGDYIVSIAEIDRVVI